MLRGEITMVTKDPELTGEHFHGNNPDIKLDFEKPDNAEIAEMSYRKPTTSYKDVKRNPASEDDRPIYMDGADVMPTPNADYAADKKNYAKGSLTNSTDSSANVA